MPYLPKQRGQKSYRLSREDLAPRQVSLNPSEFDFTGAIESHTPQTMASAQLPDIPVYNRETNRIQRYSRVVSSPVILPAMPEFVDVRSASANYLSHKEQDGPDSQPVHSASYPAFRDEKIRGEPDFKEFGSRGIRVTDSNYETPKKYLSSKGAARIQAWVDHHSTLSSSSSSSSQSSAKSLYGGYELDKGYGPKTYYDSESSARSEELSDSSRSDILQTPAIHNENVKGFPRFIPSFVPQPRHSNYYKSSSKLAALEFSNEGNTLNWVASDSSSSSQKSRGETQKSVSTTASADTKMSSVEMCSDNDASSFYEDLSDVVSTTNDKNDKLERNLEIQAVNLGTIHSPEPPKHQRKKVPEPSIPKSKVTGTRPSSKLFVPSFDYCLDLGAEYDKSRFMIPREYQVSRSKPKRNRPHVQAYIKA